MNDSALLSARVAAINADYPTSHPEVQTSASSSVAIDDACGTGLTPMSDEEREVAACRAGIAMQSWYAEYKRTGNLRCLDLAYHFLGIQKTLLAGRSPEYVARLEQERGLGGR